MVRLLLPRLTKLILKKVSWTDSRFNFKFQCPRLLPQGRHRKETRCFSTWKEEPCVQARRQFYLSVVQSKLEYATTATAYVHCLADKVQDQLLRISKRALRCIFEHDTFTRTSYLLEQNHIHVHVQSNLFRTNSKGRMVFVRNNGSSSYPYFIPSEYTVIYPTEL